MPSLRREKLSEIRKPTIARLIDRLDATPSEARHAFAAVRQLFNWAVTRSYVTNSPCEGFKPTGSAPARERVLDDRELAKILSFARSSPAPFHKVLELLIYTGQRRNEIASLRADWIDFRNRTISFPASITKNKREHRVPFGPKIESLLRSGRDDGLLFPGRGSDDKIINGWSKLKPAFDRQCALPHWTLHDLRRTFATNMAALGVAVQVTEKLLNHVSGTTGGIVAVYQRHAYLDEMREAIVKWEQHLSLLC